MFNTVTALQDIYLNPQVTKGQAYADSRLLPTPNLFDTLDQADHGRKRRIIGRVLSEHSMRTFEGTMSIEVDHFLREILRSGKFQLYLRLSRSCERTEAFPVVQPNKMMLSTCPAGASAWVQMSFLNSVSAIL